MTSAAPLVVHVVYRFAVGGLENGVVNLVNRLPQDAWRHAIVSLTDIDTAFAQRLTRSDVELIALGKGPGHAWRLYPRLWRLLRRLSPGIVHTRNLAALEVTPAAWLARVPARLHGEHGVDVLDPDGRNLRRQRIRRLFRPFVTRYVALSPDLEAYLSGPIGVAPSRIEQIFNGVDCERFAPSPERVPIERSPFNAPHFRVLGAVGRLDPVKNHAGLAQAFAAVVQRHPELRASLRLVIAGEGGERARIEAVLAQSGVRDLAWLAGERDDIPELLRGLDIFVLPSLGEGVSNTILEAMASGLPVVATGVGANAELVADGATGRIVPATDVNTLAGAIATYAGDAGLARAHGQAGRARAEQRFNLQHMVERYHRLYLSLVAGSTSAMHTPNVVTGQHLWH